MPTLFHISDSHGLPQKPIRFLGDEPIAVVHTGDMMPNLLPTLRRRVRYGVPAIEDYYTNDEKMEREIAYQTEWIKKTARGWKAWFCDYSLIYVAGNHDYIDPCPFLRDVGVDAINISTTGYQVMAEIAGVSFAGGPMIVEMGNIWNHESSEVDIAFAIDAALDQKPDVLISHGPPRGILDMVVGHGFIGSRAMEICMEQHAHKPKAHLFGHNHPDGGRVWRDEKSGTIYSNAAACRGQTIKISKETV